METDDPIYSGFLLLPPVGKSLLKKSWQQKYCLLFKASKFGIERLEVYDSADIKKETPSRIITLENCIKISSKNFIHLAITTKTSSCTFEFETLSAQSRNEWLSALQSVAFPEDASRITSIEEDNDLYCSFSEGIFNVRIHQSPASERCGLNDKMYTLVLTSTAIQLRNLTDNALLYTWPYCFIRRYGYKSGKFTFEAGRKCESGEGTFFLEHSNQQAIFKCLVSKMKSMKQLLKGESSPAILDCGDNQFHAALSMEARSRSPLPPSPTTSTTVHDIDANLSNKSPINSMQDSQKLSNIPPKPKKPPRKNLTTTTISESDTYEPIDKYDRIEYRTDAWRTMGVNDVNHTENIEDNEDDEQYISWEGSTQKNQDRVIQVIQVEAPKIITSPSVSSLVGDNSYDKLNFFGSSSKLNVKSGYKQVSAAPVIAMPCPPSFNDYDEVQPTLEGVRLADDSHLGYALVRKEPLKDDSVNHHFHNNEPYAVISKPKRV